MTLTRLRKIKNILSPVDLFRFTGSLIDKRRILIQLVKRDFTAQFRGSLLGIFWAFFQPLAFILALWFVFTVGLRSSKSSEPVPFILWLMTGMFLWFFIAECLSKSAGMIQQSSYLVKKVKFQISLIPVAKILSALLVHVIFLGLVLVMFLASGVRPTLYWLQTIYYLFAAFVLMLGLSLMFSAVSVFVQDTIQVIQIITRLGFWFTPIFWKIEMAPRKLQFWLEINPVAYLIKGYRNSLIYGVGFWETPGWTISFWVMTALIFVAGGVIFRRLRPHFADVVK